MPLILGELHCIPPIVRLVSIEQERNVLIKSLDCIQQLCLLPSYRPCRGNQEIFPKANGFNQLLVLIRKSNRDKFIQAKAITTLAYTIFGSRRRSICLFFLFSFIFQITRTIKRF